MLIFITLASCDNDTTGPSNKNYPKYQQTEVENNLTLTVETMTNEYGINMSFSLKNNGNDTISIGADNLENFATISLTAFGSDESYSVFWVKSDWLDMGGGQDYKMYPGQVFTKFQTLQLPSYMVSFDKGDLYFDLYYIWNNESIQTISAKVPWSKK